MFTKNERDPAVFGGSFDRLGKVLKPATSARPVSDYKIAVATLGELPQADKVVRQVEDDFASRYDAVQFRSLGMASMAQTDMAQLEDWVGNPRGMRILSIGPGTGREALPLAEAVGPEGKVYAIDTAFNYLDVLRTKAAQVGLNPEQLSLIQADIQRLRYQDLMILLRDNPLDLVSIWFGPLALMTTDPQGALNISAEVLKPGGKLVMTTNSLDGLAYRMPEAARERGNEQDFPLGYKPSIFTERSFPMDDVTQRPTGMILGGDSVLPASFYSWEELSKMLQQAGLEVIDSVGIARLTGLFPENLYDGLAMGRYLRLVRSIEPKTAGSMYGVSTPSRVFEIALDADNRSSRDRSKINQYNYIGFKAEKGIKE